MSVAQILGVSYFFAFQDTLTITLHYKTLINTSGQCFKKALFAIANMAFFTDRDSQLENMKHGHKYVRDIQIAW